MKERWRLAVMPFVCMFVFHALLEQMILLMQFASLLDVPKELALAFIDPFCLDCKLFELFVCPCQEGEYCICFTEYDA